MNTFSNIKLDAADNLQTIEDNLKNYIKTVSNISSIQAILFSRSDSAAVHVRSGTSTADAVRMIGVELQDDTAAQYCNLCVAYRNATISVFQAGYQLTAEDHGWPQRASHSSFIMMKRYDKNFKQMRYIAPKWFQKYNIEGIVVGETNLNAPWNTRYRPSIPGNGLTIAITDTRDVVHIEKYDVNMTFLEVLEILISKYPKVNNRSICPQNTLLSMGGRVYDNINETLGQHHILDGTLLGMLAGVHAGPRCPHIKH